MIHPPHDTVLFTSGVKWLSHGRESPTWRDPPWGEFCRGDFNGGNSVGAAPSRDPMLVCAGHPRTMLDLHRFWSTSVRLMGKHERVDEA